MADIKHYLVINESPEKVYKSITEAEDISGWWTNQVKIKPEVGSIAEFDFGDRYHNEMMIAELIENKKVEWECIKGDKEWIGTRIIFELESNKEKTILRFAHADWQKTTDFFASCNYQWGWYMTSLKNYCETGKGQPFQER